MSSDISKLVKSRWDKWWIRLHQMVSHRTRVRQLSDLFGKLLSEEIKKDIKCLDVGCGDMTIAEQIAVSNPNTAWTCLDIYPLPDKLKDAEKWKKYVAFDGMHIPFEDNSFDMVLLCDVLHHSLEPKTILGECLRVGHQVIVKDHYQYGFFSNLILKWMDRFGNQAYGVHIPGKYFSVDSFTTLYTEAGAKMIREEKGIQLYQHLPIVRSLLRPKWQFWAVLTKA